MKLLLRTVLLPPVRLLSNIAFLSFLLHLVVLNILGLHTLGPKG
jgi:hypothetical protein